jgi:hypothetical protein
MFTYYKLTDNEPMVIKTYTLVNDPYFKLVPLDENEEIYILKAQLNELDLKSIRSSRSVKIAELNNEEPDINDINQLKELEEKIISLREKIKALEPPIEEEPTEEQEQTEEPTQESTEEQDNG